LINSTNQISQNYISSLSNTLSTYYKISDLDQSLSAYFQPLIDSSNQLDSSLTINLDNDIRLINRLQTKMSLANRIDSSFVSFNGISLGDWFDYYYNKTETNTILSSKQNLMTSTNKLDSSRIAGLINGSTTMLSSFVYVNPQMNLNTYLDLNFENKQQRLTNSININAIQLMINNMSLKTISLKNSTRSGQISGGMLYENENGYLNILQYQDNTNIIFDVTSTKLSTFQPFISDTNKISSDFVNVNGISLTNCVHCINH
jgi:hypothetical protein